MDGNPLHRNRMMLWREVGLLSNAPKRGQPSARPMPIDARALSDSLLTTG
ncbi:hypothetical protein C8J44_1364 [Sphingomonas sp. PP-CE-3A-406]|jgi:hypothetical protein|nr:hypothetical protein C8J44_1364 [Sphingomonas sp. PP-CE-3A-406]